MRYYYLQLLTGNLLKPKNRCVTTLFSILMMVSCPLFFRFVSPVFLARVPTFLEWVLTSTHGAF